MPHGFTGHPTELARTAAGKKDRGFTTETFAASLRLVRRIIPAGGRRPVVAPDQAAAISATLLDWADRLDP